ncbi:helicase HerA domain-containing protein [Actinoplanes sp. CA-142083]|uniref:helicase HerA domain-containing protein n=1 Tax=Actinoplanes sp. CA-142083 TaxID=3239903 RepID=UPI003D9330F2
MNDAQRRALAALRLSWAPTPDDVWRASPYHVEGLHQDILDLVMEGVDEAARNTDSPMGIALQGQRGTGKTHLLGTVRERVQVDGGYFFLIEMLESKAFWRSTTIALIDGFARQRPDGDSQLVFFLRQLAELIDAPRPVRRSLIGEYELTRPALDAFIDLLRKHHRQIGMDCQDTARALALQASGSTSAQDIGYGFLCSNDEEQPGDRAAWGMRRGKRSAQEIVRDISRLLALTGPTIVAVDQIDVLIAQSVKSTAAGDRANWQTSLLLEQIAGGLMSLRESTRRTLSVVACLPKTWQDIKDQVTDTVQDRFREAVRLKEIPSRQVGEALVARRFASRFAEVDFEPPYPTWPVQPGAFAEAEQFTPRELLRTVDRHVRACLADGEIRELEHLLYAVPERPEVPVADEPATGSETAGFDARHDELLKISDPGPAFHKDTEDVIVPELLRAGLTAWIAEQGPAGEMYAIDPQSGGKPALHARLRRALDANDEDEEHWSFRAIAATHHIAALNRIKNATTSAGLTEGVTRRRLFLLRTAPWSAGTRTQEVIKAFRQAGGETLPFPDEDVVRLMALHGLIAEYGEEALRSWFARRRPTDEISVLRESLIASESVAPEPIAPEPVASGPVGSAIEIGEQIDGSGRVAVSLEALRRHTAIFAGSGSGKTVLIRRLIEECALQGVSAIVLDTNNDLARLGDPHPSPPASWWLGDADRAAEYFANTDVVVWTPRRRSGRPLSFRPLPDFAEIVDDPDTLEAGIEVAVAALAPHARAEGNTDKARLSQSVLRQALVHYARRGGGDLPALIDLLGDLPEGVSDLGDDGIKLAAKMSQLLTAATINDPLLGGVAALADPGELLTPPPGKRARISVISFVGLPELKQQQTFVNQLQVALFAWIKRHPATDRPLGGLLVMDEAQNLAPSGAMTPCTHSTLMLASQARKYGLGLVFATQAPKSLHNRIPGNAATQFFGLLTSMTQIDAAQEIARVKGSPIPDVGRMDRGEFYAAIEGAGFVKIQAPFCLSHHPPSPLTTEEVIQRAAAGA